MNILQTGQSSALKLSKNVVPSISASQAVITLPSTTTTTTTTSTTTTTTISTTVTTTTTSTTESTPMPGDPYLSINPKFAILPAVPGVKTPVQVKTPLQERLPKKIPPGKEASLLIPARFMPLPAVPLEDTAGDLKNFQEVADVNNTVEEVLEKVEEKSEKYTNKVSPVKAVPAAPGPSDARRAYKRCHGKCVQKFCLPVTSLALFDECTAKCGGICTQK